MRSVAPRLRFQTAAGRRSCLTRCVSRLREEPLGLGERGFVAHRCEQIARLGERHLRARVAEHEQAAALAKEGVRALGDVPERAPAFSRIGVQGRGLGMIAGRLRQSGAAGGERVLVQRRSRLDLGESRGQVRSAERERAPYELGRQLSMFVTEEWLVGELAERSRASADLPVAAKYAADAASGGASSP